MDYLELGPIGRVRGTVRLPGSKSISNRTLLLAALADGETRVRDLLDSDDTRYMLEALRALGVPCRARRPDDMRDRGHRRRLPGQASGALSGQRGHGVSAADGGARAGGRRVPPVRRAAHARAADRRSGRRACAAHRRAHRLSRQAGLPAAAHPCRTNRSRSAGADPRQRVEPVRHGAADGAAAHRTRVHGRGRRRAHFQALRRDHAEHDAALRRHGRATRLDELHRAGRRALPQSRARSTSKAMRRRLRIFWPQARSAA